MSNAGRRRALCRGLQIIAALSVGPMVVRRVVAAESCVEPASEPLRTALHYADPSPKKDQTCSACGFFTAGKKDPCGDCMIMSGAVSSKGRCDSWAPKS